METSRLAFGVRPIAGPAMPVHAGEVEDGGSVDKQLHCQDSATSYWRYGQVAASHQDPIGHKNSLLAAQQMRGEAFQWHFGNWPRQLSLDRKDSGLPCKWGQWGRIGQPSCSNAALGSCQFDVCLSQ